MTQVEETTTTLARVRFTYARGEALRYVSHLDMQLVWERTLRRAGLPIAFSQGFNPRPRLHMASALPLGFLSRCELADIWLNWPALNDEDAIDLTALMERVQHSAPPGLELLRCETVSLQQPALQTQVQAAEYWAVPLDPMDAAALQEAIARLLAADQLPRERRGKPYDLRPLIETLEPCVDSGPAGGDPLPGGPGMWMRLSARDGATGRPEEVLDALGLDPAAFRVERMALVLGEK